jgi:predicted transposase YbfD/YdcC
MEATKAWKILEAVRQHWQIENQLHWSLDVAFHEDKCKIRVVYAAENMSRLRHIAQNLLKQETSKKLGIANKRKKAGWSHTYLLKVLHP